MADSQNPIKTNKSYTKRPHLYVLYTMSGEEQELINLLYKTLVEVPDTSRSPRVTGASDDPVPESTEAESDQAGPGYSNVVIPFYDECLFSPVAIFNKKFHGQFMDIPKRLYPGYIFLNTNVPEDFYNRLIRANFFSRYGKSLRMLRDFGAAKNFAKNASYRPGTPDEKEFQAYMARLSDEEERSLLSLFGLERDEHGNVVRSRLNELPDEMKERLENVGVELDVPDERRETMDGRTMKNAAYCSPAPDVNFVVRPSTGIKIGTGPGSRIVVYKGPLQGKEGQIAKVNRHKRIAWIRVPFMGTERLIQMPLSVVKVIDPE